MDVEPAPRPLAIEDSGVRSLFASDGDRLAPEVEITVAVAGVGGRCDHDLITMLRLVDRGLDRLILSRYVQHIPKRASARECHHCYNENPPRDGSVVSHRDSLR